MSCRLKKHGAGSCVICADSVVSASTGDLHTIRRHGDPTYGAASFNRLTGWLSSTCIPETDGAIVRPRYEEATIGRERYRKDVASMPCEWFHRDLARLRIPEAYCVIM